MPRRVTPSGDGKRIPLMARTTADLRSRLEMAASASGRSLGQEVEYQLERALMVADLTRAIRETIRQEVRAEFDARAQVREAAMDRARSNLIEMSAAVEHMQFMLSGEKAN